MKAAFGTAGLRCSFFAILMAGSLLVAQDKKTEPKALAGAKKSVNRVPKYYAKLNLTEDQRKKILEIQSANDPKIEELTAQLKALQSKEEADVEAVLTPDQSKQLATMKAEAMKKADDEKAAKAKAKGGDKKPDDAAATKEPGKKSDGEKKPEGEKKPTEKKP